MLITIPDHEGPQAVDGPDMVGHFGFCIPVELNLITKVLFFYIVLKLWFSPKKVNCNCDTRLLSC